MPKRLKGTVVMDTSDKLGPDFRCREYENPPVLIAH
jgi:hypothetical protein